MSNLIDNKFVNQRSKNIVEFSLAMLFFLIIFCLLCEIEFIYLLKQYFE